MCVCCWVWLPALSSACAKCCQLLKTSQLLAVWLQASKAAGGKPTLQPSWLLTAAEQSRDLRDQRDVLLGCSLWAQSKFQHS